MNLSQYELNILFRSMNDHESALMKDWERAQKASPFGARATSIVQELKELRRLADKLSAEYSALNAAA
jgi:hypothetical protein